MLGGRSRNADVNDLVRDTVAINRLPRDMAAVSNADFAIYNGVNNRRQLALLSKDSAGKNVVSRGFDRSNDWRAESTGNSNHNHDAEPSERKSAEQLRMRGQKNEIPHPLPSCFPFRLASGLLKTSDKHRSRATGKRDMRLHDLIPVVDDFLNSLFEFFAADAACPAHFEMIPDLVRFLRAQFATQREQQHRVRYMCVK